MWSFYNWIRTSVKENKHWASSPVKYFRGSAVCHVAGNRCSYRVRGLSEELSRDATARRSGKVRSLTAFGRSLRVLCDAAECSVEPNIAQSLHVINGDTVNKKLSAPDGFAALSLKLGLSNSRLLDTL